jgi:L-alanine-DL-glutamate epimerase-like enolase superfamily enzyme
VNAEGASGCWVPDPRPFEAHVWLLQALRRAAAGWIAQQAIGAIENALLDLKASRVVGGRVRCYATPTTHPLKPTSPYNRDQAR